MSKNNFESLGMRHVALNVKDAQSSKDFYCKYFGMTVEWEPDPKSVYLTTKSQDNLALHQAHDYKKAPGLQSLDHLGFFMKTKDDVDALYAAVKEDGVQIAKDIKLHRDGAYSFYLKDPDDIIVQILYHPPLCGSAS